jgi:hypothetical protein
MNRLIALLIRLLFANIESNQSMLLVNKILTVEVVCTYIPTGSYAQHVRMIGGFPLLSLDF